MQRVVRTGGMQAGRPWFAGNDPADEWRGARLRPTGVVVFATLDRPGLGSAPCGVLDTPARSAGLDASARPELVRAGGGGVSSPLRSAGPRPSGAVVGHHWRQRALRSVDWLLGR